MFRELRDVVVVVAIVVVVVDGAEVVVASGRVDAAATGMLVGGEASAVDHKK
jgi:hypothetical protein